MPLPRLRRRLAALALLATTPLAMAAPIQPADLQCQFQATAEPGGPVTLHFTLRNAGKTDLHLLRWGSPFEGAWFGPFVRVSTPQGELPFQGAMRKRGDPSPDDYLLLRAGYTLAAVMPLGDAFALPPTGPLRLVAGWRWHDVIVGAAPPRPRSQHRGWDQSCGEATLTR